MLILILVFLLNFQLIFCAESQSGDGLPYFIVRKNLNSNEDTTSKFIKMLQEFKRTPDNELAKFLETMKKFLNEKSKFVGFDLYAIDFNAEFHTKTVKGKSKHNFLGLLIALIRKKTATKERIEFIKKIALILLEHGTDPNFKNYFTIYPEDCTDPLCVCYEENYSFIDAAKNNGWIKEVLFEFTTLQSLRAVGLPNEINQICINYVF